jgi:hypothetical protein
MVQQDRDIRLVPKADITGLFDHFVGGGEQRLWDGQFEPLATEAV